jgi:integrase
MATFQKRGDKWRAIVRIKGVTETKSFDRKQDAAGWATAREAEINAADQGIIPDKTFRQLLEKYRDEKAKARADIIRVNRFIADDIASVRLQVLDAGHFAQWRDRRAASVSAATVIRERNALSTICTYAIEELKWLKRHPVRGVKMPEAPAPRDRLITAKEIELLAHCMSYTPDTTLGTITKRTYAAFLFAIETGMRIGEIAAMTWDDVEEAKRFVRVRGEDVGAGKTRAARRDVPLSAEALRILAQVKRTTKDKSLVFDFSAASADSLFRHWRDKSGIPNLHFHDTRHLACTRLSRKLDVLALARMIGHKDIRMLMVYYNESAEALATRL